MKPTLLDRAKDIIRSKSGKLAIAAVPLGIAAAESRADVTFSLNSETAHYTGGSGGGYFPSSYTSISGSPIHDGIQLSGQFAVTGQEYENAGANATDINLSGTFTGTIPAGQTAVTYYGLDPTFASGGVVLESIVANVGGLSANVSPSASLQSGVLYAGTFQSSPAGSAITNGSFSIDITFQWSSEAYSGTTLNLALPAGDFDLDVPEPVSGAIIFLPALAMLRRKNRHQTDVSPQKA